MYVKGTEFLELASLEEDINVALTFKLIDQKKSGKRISKTFKHIGDGLVLMTLLASSKWGRGSDPQMLQFFRRMSNHLHAAVRLATSGYYEEALSQIRSAAEGANLLQLFRVDPTTILQWKENPLSLLPGRVRTRIEETEAPVVPQETYKALCEVGTHISPGYLDLSHSPSGAVLIGATVSMPGMALFTGQAASVLAASLSLTAVTIGIRNKARLKQVRNLVERLSRDGPNINATNYKEYMAEFGGKTRHKELMRRIHAMPEPLQKELWEKGVAAVKKRIPKDILDNPSSDMREKYLFPMMAEILLKSRSKKKGFTVNDLGGSSGAA